MQNDNKKVIAQHLLGMASVYGKELNDVAIAVMVKQLSIYQVTQVVKAIENLMLTSEYMPTLATIVKTVTGKREEDIKSRASFMFNNLVWDKLGSFYKGYTGYDNVIFEDEITNNVFHDMGGVKRFSNAQITEQPFLENKFVEMYCNYARANISIERGISKGNCDENKVKLITNNGEMKKVTVNELLQLLPNRAKEIQNTIHPSLDLNKIEQLVSNSVRLIS